MDCSSIVSSQLTDPTNARAHLAIHKLVWPRPGRKNQLASSKSKSQLFSKITKNPSPSLPGMTSFTSLFLFPTWSFYCDIFDCHILPPRARTPALMSGPTHALSRKVLSLTKPKDKIYKTKNDNIKKSFRNYITCLVCVFLRHVNPCCIIYFRVKFFFASCNKICA